MFKAKEYVMPSDPLRIDPTVRDLCRTIDKTLEEQDEILKVLQDTQIKLNLSLSLWGASIGRCGNIKQRILAGDSKTS
jgi:hypothetical protein